MRAYIAYARELPRVAREIRANLRTPMPAPWIDYGVNAFGGFAQFFSNDVAAVFSSVKDPALQTALAQANAGAASAMQGLADWLKSERPRATQEFALGAELFARMLAATEQVDVPLARLSEIGRADLERNLAALREICSTYTPGKTLRQCADTANSHKPEGGAVAAARRQLPETEGVRAAKGTRYHSRARGGAGRPGAALQRAEFCVHHHGRSVREQERALGLLHLTTRSELDSGGTGSIRVGRRHVAVDLRSRSVARPFPALPARESQPVQDRTAVPELCLHGRLGALHRGDDATGRAARRAAPSGASGNCCPR